MPFHPQMALTSYVTTSGGGGGGVAPALPTITSTGQTEIFRLYADAPTAHLYQDNALTSQAAAGNTVFGVKDISGASNNFANTPAGKGAALTAAALNGKNGLVFNGSTSFIESDNSTNINLARTASNIALIAVFRLTGTPGQPYLFMGSVKSRTSATDCLALRIGGSGSNIVAGRWGASSQNNFPLSISSTTLNAPWTDFTNKTIKLVLRAATGVGSVQRLDLAVSDGTTTRTGTTTYTNNGVDDVDATSTLWDYFCLDAWYSNSVSFGGPPGILAETVMWSGTSQMNSTDVASLLSYMAGTAGF